MVACLLGRSITAFPGGVLSRLLRFPLGLLVLVVRLPVRLPAYLSSYLGYTVALANARWRSIDFNRVQPPP